MQKITSMYLLHDFTLLNSPTIGLDRYLEDVYIFGDTISDPKEIQYYF